MSIKKRGIHLLVIALAVVGAGLFNIATSYTTVSAAPDAAWCKANVSASAPESRKDDADFKANECASVCRFTPAIDVGYVNGLPMKAPSKWTCQDSSSTTTPIANACASFSAGSDERTACEAGFTNNGNAEYCSKTYPVNAPSDQEKRTACEKGAVAAGVKLPTPPAPPGEAARKPTCSGGAIGWLLCPVVNLMQIANDMMAPQIENQLTIPPLMSGTATYLGTFKIWQMMVGIGNLILILGFLIVIFSQATSMGISAYGVKKLMPRIIAAAILINLSYFICAIAIDITNVIGASVKGIIGVGLDQVRITGNATPSFGEGAGSIMLAIVGVGALLVTGAVAYLVPALVMVVMSLMVVFLGLALRKVIIILLIVTAPLAFAAMILPGTEGLFKKWQKTFINLLVMYPVIMALLYGSMLVSNIILATDSNAVQMINAGGNPEADGMTAGIAGAGIVNVLLAYAVLGLGPAIGSYMYIKSSNKLFAMAANAVNKAGAGLRSASMGFAKDKQKRSVFGQMSQQRRQLQDAAAQRKMLDRYGGEGRMGSIYRGLTTAGVGGILSKKGRQQASRSFGAQVDAAKMAQRDSEMKAISNNVGAQAAELVAEGAYYDTTSNKWKYGKDRIGANGTAVKSGDDIDGYDAATMGGLSYLQKNGYAATGGAGGRRTNTDTNAMRSAIDSLASTGKLTSTTLQSAFDNTAEADRSGFIEYANASADKAGLKHLRYNTVSGDGKTLNLGGQKGAAGMTGVADSIVEGGVQGVSKYVFKDKAFHGELKGALDRLHGKNPNKFWADLAQTNQDQLDGIMQAYGYDATHDVVRIGGNMVTRSDFLRQVKAAAPKQNT